MSDKISKLVWKIEYLKGMKSRNNNRWEIGNHDIKMLEAMEESLKNYRVDVVKEIKLLSDDELNSLIFGL